MTTVAAPTADVEARLRDFALAILGGAPSRELEPGPAPPLAEEGAHPRGRAGRTDRLIKRDVASRVEERTEELAQKSSGNSIRKLTQPESVFLEP